MLGLPRGIAAAGLIALCAAALQGCASVPPPVASAPPPAAKFTPHGPPPTFETPQAPLPVRRVERLDRLAGWADEDHLAALDAYRRGCGVAKAPAWRAACKRAREQTILDEASARAFFEDNFRAEIRSASGLLTGYFAPEYPARDEPDEIFTAPVLPRPGDLQVVPASASEGGRRSYRAGPDGPEPYPERAVIEARPVDRPLAFMKPEDLFFLQIQGSGSLLFPDGRRQKVIYAADNGRPFLGIARPMADAGLLAPQRTSADGIRSWLADHRGPEANAVMDKNPRYVFFTTAPDDRREPAGSAGIELPRDAHLRLIRHSTATENSTGSTRPPRSSTARCEPTGAWRWPSTAGRPSAETSELIFISAAATTPASRPAACATRFFSSDLCLSRVRAAPGLGGMRRSLRAEELRIWAEVAASVRPLAGKTVPPIAEPAPPVSPPVASTPSPPSPYRAPAKRPGPKPSPKAVAPAPPPPPDLIEPLRRRRIVRGRDPIDSRLDLHGLDQDRARVALVRFLQRAHGEGLRAVLVITGKGALGDGVLRRRAPDWLEDPLIRPLIAGVSPADRRHGGAGAFYIALKRRT